MHCVLSPQKETKEERADRVSMSIAGGADKKSFPSLRRPNNPAQAAASSGSKTGGGGVTSSSPVVVPTAAAPTATRVPITDAEILAEASTRVISKIRGPILFTAPHGIECMCCAAAAAAVVCTL